MVTLCFPPPNYSIENGSYIFDLNYGEEIIEDIQLSLGGKHNVENAVAAIITAKTFDISNKEIKKALASFKGIYRRFEKRAEKNNLVYIDDYAHHPNEIKALLGSIKEMYPSKKITAIFQPHLFSRTKDLAIDFAEHLSIADEIILLPIYPARELPIEGVTSEIILKNIKAENKVLVKKEDLMKYLKSNIVSQNNEQIILSIGAGDIDRFIPRIVELIENN